MPVFADGALVFEEDCAPRRLLDLFAVKWTSLVIHALYHWPGGTCRSGVLQRSLSGISRKMLVQTLRDLEDRGLVARRVFESVPPRVEYALTPLGRVFAEPVEMMLDWGEAHHDALDQVQANLSASARAARDEVA